MTGNEIYTQALGFLMESPREDRAFYENALSLINSGIVELWSVQNSRNRAEGKDEVQAKITSLEEEIPLDAELCAILPIYLAAQFYRDDLDDKSADIFYERFLRAKDELKKLSFTDVTDIYGGADYVL